MAEIQVINGSENSTHPDSPLSILVEFYQAFNQQNLALMARNWLQSESIAMSNPLGGVKRGWNEIGAVYERIFNGPARVFVEFYDFNIQQTDLMFCVVGHERGYFELANKRIELAIRTSRIYQNINNRWQQIHHHGSIDRADLLKQYQTAVLELSRS